MVNGKRYKIHVITHANAVGLQHNVMCRSKSVGKIIIQYLSFFSALTRKMGNLQKKKCVGYKIFWLILKRFLYNFFCSNNVFCGLRLEKCD